MTLWISVRGPADLVPVVLSSLVFLAIIILSLFPGTVVSPGRWNLGHVPAYATFVICIIFSIAKNRRTPLGLLAIGLFTSLFGGGIELLQPVVGRHTSLVDFMYNELGILIALVLYSLYTYITMTSSGFPVLRSPKRRQK
jgi:VanZ family protein